MKKRTYYCINPLYRLREVIAILVLAASIIWWTVSIPYIG